MTVEPSALFKDIAYVGYLMKRNPTGAWQKRYCVVTSVKFIYYKHKSRVEKGLPQGTVSLVGSTCTTPEPGDINCLKRENCFILKSCNKEYYLSCDAKKDFSDWMKALSNIKNDSYAHPHSFKKVHFSKATPCAKCNTPITGLGKQGFMCQVCMACVHKKCAFKLEEDCYRGSKGAPARPAATAKKGIIERFRMTFTTTPAHQYASLDVPQLQLVLIQAEEVEKREIESVTTKYDTQVQEVMDELIYRYLKEVAASEGEYKKKKAELLKEIEIRQHRQKQS